MFCCGILIVLVVTPLFGGAKKDAMGPTDMLDPLDPRLDSRQ